MADSAHVLIGRSRLFRYPIASFPSVFVRFQELQDFDRRRSYPTFYYYTYNNNDWYHRQDYRKRQWSVSHYQTEIISADKISTGDFNAIMIGAGFVSLDLD